MKRYFKLYYQFWRTGLMSQLEFRVNLLVWTTMGFFWLGLGFVSVELIFGQIQSIAGWSKNEVFLLVATALMFNDFMWTFFWDSLNQFSGLIGKGELDSILLKPIRPRFYLSFRFPEFDHWLRIFFLIFFIRKLAINLAQPTWFHWLGYWLAFGLGVWTFYNLLFSLIVTNIWFIRLFNTGDLVDTFIDIGRQPMEIFKGKLKLFFTLLVPVALVAYFPVMLLLGRFGPEIFLIILPLALLTTIFSQWFWQFSLKHYSGASA